ncbi:hypothetical protein [Demequina sp.]|uniref:hypothetical protein n=1 Tax=Demequina sp. TaxID=2050685 RepID=UPI0025BAE50C|nr:hypothetical protein [Demequina sp.]
MQGGAALLVGVLVAGCGAESDDNDGGELHSIAAGKWGTGEVLTGLTLMVERVPSLASAVTISYSGGPSREPDGDREVTVPGPTDSWIEAVVTFAPGDAVPASECGWADTMVEPNVVPALEDELGDGPWWECQPGAFPAAGWTVLAYLDADDNVVLLQMTTI